MIAILEVWIMTGSWIHAETINTTGDCNDCADRLFDTRNVGSHPHNYITNSLWFKVPLNKCSVLDSNAWNKKSVCWYCIIYKTMDQNCYATKHTIKQWRNRRPAMCSVRRQRYVYITGDSWWYCHVVLLMWQQLLNGKEAGIIKQATFIKKHSWKDETFEVLWYEGSPVKPHLWFS